MRRRSMLVAAAIAASCALVPSVAQAAGSASDSDNGSPLRLLYTFDDCAAADCGPTISDSSGSGNHGTVLGVTDGKLNPVPGWRDGKAIQPAGALVQLTNTAADEGFNTGRRAFSYGAMVKVDEAFTTDANLMQRGRYSDATNQWKLQLDAGRQGCSVKGDQGRVMVFAPTDLPADGRWHAVTCVITPEHVAYVVDGTVHRTPNTAGSITFTETELLHVGGVFNADGRINDPFTKPIDNVFFVS